LLIEDFDATATTGLGSEVAVYSTLGSGVDLSRYDNEASYILPGNLGGFYGTADVAAGEGTDGKKMMSGRVGYKMGALNVSGAYAETNAKGDKFKLTTLGGSYDFGMAKVLALYSTTKFGPHDQKVLTLTVTAPLGAGLVWATYSNSDYSNSSKLANVAGDAVHYAAGYVYNMSKRTALYTTVALIDNGKGATFALSNSPKVAADGRSGGFDVGVKHSF
jgi:predicted porin